MKLLILPKLYLNPTFTTVFYILGLFDDKILVKLQLVQPILYKYKFYKLLEQVDTCTGFLYKLQLVQNLNLYSCNLCIMNIFRLTYLFNIYWFHNVSKVGATMLSKIIYITHY